MSFTAQLFIHCNSFSVDKFNSKYQLVLNIFCLLFFAMIIEIKCYEVIGMSSLQCYSVLSTIAQVLRKMSLKILVS